MDKLNFKLGEEVKEARKNNLPVVALETLLIEMTDSSFSSISDGLIKILLILLLIH